MLLRKMLLQLQCFRFDSEVVQRFLQSASCRNRYIFLCYLLNAVFVTLVTFRNKMLAVAITYFSMLCGFDFILPFHVSVLLQPFLLLHFLTFSDLVFQIMQVLFTSHPLC